MAISSFQRPGQNPVWHLHLFPVKPHIRQKWMQLDLEQIQNSVTPLRLHRAQPGASCHLLTPGGFRQLPSWGSKPCPGSQPILQAAARVILLKGVTHLYKTF